MTTVDPNDEVEPLRREVAGLKKLLAASQTEPGQTMPVADGLELKAFRFLDLPRELRNAVYELCAVVDKVYIHHVNTIKIFDMRVTSTTLPELQVFRVCKQIHNEARELFLLKNLFVMTAGPCTVLHTLRQFVASIDVKFLRRLSISFDYRDYAAAGVCQYKAAVRRSTFKRNGLDEDEIQSAMLDTMQSQTVCEVWCPMVAALAPLRLDYLQVNLQNCYDPTGGARAVISGFETPCEAPPAEGGVIDYCNRTDIPRTLRSMRGKVIDVVGTVDKAERECLRECLGGLSSHELQFHGGTGCVNEMRDGSWDERREVVEYEKEEDERMASMLRSRFDELLERMDLDWDLDEEDGEMDSDEQESNL